MKLFDRFPIRYVVPNAVTCSGLVLGIASIHTSLTASTVADLVLSAWMIVWCTLLDKLDGSVARRLNASSDIGVQLDSFSDFVTFGLAPAALVTRAAPSLLPDPWALPVGSTILAVTGVAYVLAAVLRLAKFNVTDSPVSKGFFLGLPSTSSGGILGTAFLTLDEFGAPPVWMHCLVALMALNAVLMVTNIPLPKLKLGKGRAWRALQIANIAASYILAPLRLAPWYLLGAGLGYTVIGFAYGIAKVGRATIGIGGGTDEVAED